MNRERMARMGLCALKAWSSPALARAWQDFGAAELWEALVAEGESSTFGRRAAVVDPAAVAAAGQACGARFIMPGDEEWPAPLADLVGRFEGCGTDVWAATRIDAPRPHLQSFLLGFRGGVLGREELRAFFAGVRPTTSKVDVVKQYELGLSQVVEASGLTWSVGWPNAALGLAPNVDPTMGGWAVLLQGGFPFVKRRLLSADGPGIPRASVLAAVQGRYGEDPDLPR